MLGGVVIQHHLIPISLTPTTENKESHNILGDVATEHIISSQYVLHQPPETKKVTTC